MICHWVLPARRGFEYSNSASGPPARQQQFLLGELSITLIITLLCPVFVGTPERTQILLAATQTPLLSDAKWGVRLLPELCKVVLHLPSQARQVPASHLCVSVRQPVKNSLCCYPSLPTLMGSHQNRKITLIAMCRAVLDPGLVGVQGGPAAAARGAAAAELPNTAASGVHSTLSQRG